MKTKAKTKIKKTPVKTTKARSRKNKKYSTSYLALILTTILLLEGLLFGITTPKDWKDALVILDVSSAVTETAHDTAAFFQPEAQVLAATDHFFKLASIEMAKMFDFSDMNPINDVAEIYYGVNAFYEQSSIQMASLLDLSDSVHGLGRVSGISIEVSR
jgi:hypothetical protein